MDFVGLRSLLREAIGDLKELETTPNLTRITEALGLPSPVEASSKRLRLHGAVDAAPDKALRKVAERFVEKFSPRIDLRDQLQELIWSEPPAPVINKRLRRELANALDRLDVFGAAKGFDALLTSLFSVEATPSDAVLGRPSLRERINRNVYRNPGQWSGEQLFEEIGAFACSDARFCRFIEGLASPDVRPDVDEQRNFVNGVNPILRAAHIELREVGEKDGYPEFTLASLDSKPLPRPKNLIFASTRKPDLRFADAVDNDVEVVTNVDAVLIYEDPIGPEGLRWCDLQAWWARREGLVGEEEQSKRTLYKRLLESLPASSPPQAFLFRSFFETFREAVPTLPVPLPEVWLHWDPVRAAERGKNALTRHRMDFLMLMPRGVRVVLEVDGQQHYAEAGAPSPRLYAEMVAADRDLRLSGYEVYRFGGYELDGTGEASAMLKEFFVRLFRRNGIAGP